MTSRDWGYACFIGVFSFLYIVAGLFGDGWSVSMQGLRVRSFVFP